MSTDPPPKEPPTESAMPPAQRQRLQQCFERGNDMANRSKPDFDYAHDLYAQCVINDPGNLVYVEALLNNLQRKYKNNRKGSRLRGFGGRKAFNNAMAEEDWAEVYREGMDLLKSNPWEVSTLRALAEVCAAHHYNEVELRYLKNALDAKPKDAEVNRHCAHSLARMGQFDMAIACWNRVAEASKSDDPEKMISELTLAKTMGAPLSAETMGLTGDRPVIASPTPAQAASAEAEAEKPEAAEDAGPDQTDEPRREIKLNARQKLERAIRESPTEAENYLQLAELHSSQNRFHDAEQTLHKAIEASGLSLQLQTAYEDARIRSAKTRVAIAEKRAAHQKTEEAKELVGKLRDELNRLELDVFQERCRRHPDNKRLHFDLGLRLRRAGNYLEAIKSFDEARREPKCTVAATLEMGECWQQLKQYAKALKCYEVAIEKSSELDGDRQKLALYRGGVLAAALHQNDDAKRCLTRLLDIDPHFKDTAARLDKLGTIGENE